MENLTITQWSERSESLIKFAPAFSKFQAEIEGVKKDANNPFFKSKYAELSSVWDAIREPLTKNGFSVLQEPGSEDGKLIMTTTLLHSSGEYVRSSVKFPIVKQDPQGVGSAITYARRYSLQSITGIAPEDDDGNAASNPGTSNNSRVMPAPSKQKVAVASDLNKPLHEQVIPLGKHKGTKWGEVNVNYLQWLSDQNMSLSPQAKAELDRRAEMGMPDFDAINEQAGGDD